MWLALVRLGMVEQALVFGRRACAAAPGDPNFATNLANCLVLTGRAVEGVALLERHARGDPGHFGVAATLAEALTAAWRYDEAVEHARACIARFGAEPDLVIPMASGLL